MPELPDITLYVERLRERIVARALERARVLKPFLLRTVDPPLTSAEQRTVTQVRRLGKRIAIGLEDEIWLVIHLMVAGRLHWQEERPLKFGRNDLATFDFPHGTLRLTEAGTKKRASLRIARGPAALAAHDPGGIEPLECTFETFCAALQRENHTLKRALTSPKLISGIGNAYSDEILHAARLSPVLQTSRLSDLQKKALFDAVREVLGSWSDRLRTESPAEFPTKVTAFRPGMAVHGRFGQPCPDCGAAVQRIRYREHETNYCAVCQNSGRILADRSLSRLLKDDWPRSIEE
jgi:formamidopyrimidine-DNA glycosylase